MPRSRGAPVGAAVEIYKTQDRQRDRDTTSSCRVRPRVLFLRV